MLKKLGLSVIGLFYLLPFIYWNRTIGILLLLVAIIVVFLQRNPFNLAVKILISLTLCFNTHWIYFNLSGFFFTHYFAIKDLTTEIRNSGLSKLEISDGDEQYTLIEEKMRKLDFNSFFIDSTNTKLSFYISSQYWSGTPSAKQPEVSSRQAFYKGTSYPTEVAIISIVE